MRCSQPRTDAQLTKKRVSGRLDKVVDRKREMKKLFYLLALVLSLVFWGCSSKEMNEFKNLSIEHVDVSGIENGIYSGEYTYLKFTYKVAVHINEHKITKIDIINNRSSSQSKMAEEIAANIVAEQRNDVDVISGATTTSKALLKAIENALSGS